MTPNRRWPSNGGNLSDPIKDLMAEGNLDKVADELYEQLRIDSDSPGTHALLGALLTSLARFGEAEGILREAIDLDPGDAYSYAHLGRTLFALRRFDEAADTIRRAVQLAPDDPAVLGVAGSVLGELGYDDESVTLDRKALRLSPKSADLHVSLAFGLRQLGHFHEAEQALREALQLNDGDAGAHTNLGEVYLLAGDHDAARHSLLRAIELAPQATMKAHVLLGVLQRIRNPKAARDTLQAALTATDPYQSAFAASEMRAIALTTLGNAETAGHLLQGARSQRIPSDTFRKPIYDLLHQPPLAGVELLLAVWQQIITDDGTAARPFGPPLIS